VASHTGYQRIGANHTRSFVWEKDEITIIDEVQKEPGQTAEAFLHFHPGVEVALEKNTLFAGSIKIVLEGASHIHLELYFYAPRFNQLIPATKAVITFQEELQTTIQL
jgi:hypothetical protein